MMVVIAGGCVAGHRDARAEQLAGIGLVLHRDAYGNRLQTLKAGGRLEMGALLAAMQGGATLGAVAFPIDIRGHSRRTVEATGCDNILQKAREARAGDINRRARA